MPVSLMMQHLFINGAMPGLMVCLFAGVYVEGVQVIWISHSPPLLWEAHARRWHDPRVTRDPMTLQPDPLAWEEWDMGSMQNGAGSLGAVTHGSAADASGSKQKSRQPPVLYMNTNLQEYTWRKPPLPMFPSMPGM